jgi:hypothetical protein
MCRHWARGYCQLGNSCGFAHSNDAPPPQPKVTASPAYPSAYDPRTQQQQYDAYAQSYGAQLQHFQQQPSSALQQQLQQQQQQSQHQASQAAVPSQHQYDAYASATATPAAAQHYDPYQQQGPLNPFGAYAAGASFDPYKPVSAPPPHYGHLHPYGFPPASAFADPYARSYDHMPRHQAGPRAGGPSECRHWSRGYCALANNCKFSHSPAYVPPMHHKTKEKKSNQQCRNWAKGFCSAQNCKYVHSNAPGSGFGPAPEKKAQDTCRHFAKGFCERGDSCNFSHSVPQPPREVGPSSPPKSDSHPSEGSEVCVSFSYLVSFLPLARSLL